MKFSKFGYYIWLIGKYSFCCSEIAGASSKTVAAKKAPEFNTIHKRLFGKMESVVDSKQKIVDRANSMQKSQQKVCMFL